MSECKLCLLAKHSPNNIKTLFEDEEIKVIFYPTIVPGHIAVIPKEHFTVMMKVPEKIIHKIFLIAQKFCKEIVNETEYEEFDLISNNGVDQAHPHFSLHIIPRKKDDGLNFKWQPQQVDDASLDLVLEHLKGKVESAKKEDEASEKFAEYIERLP